MSDDARIASQYLSDGVFENHSSILSYEILSFRKGEFHSSVMTIWVK